VIVPAPFAVVSKIGVRPARSPERTRDAEETAAAGVKRTVMAKA